MLLDCAEAESHLPWTDENQALLPMITALFVDGLQAGHRLPAYGAERLKMPRGACGRPEGRIFRVPLAGDSPPPCSLRSQPVPGVPADVDEPVGSVAPEGDEIVQRQLALRMLIRWISHHFNNIFMSLWGNATLIRMQLSTDDAGYTHTVKMERLIQSGAFVTHMVLGYLAERRTEARRIRLNQLLLEMNQATGTDCDGVPGYDYEARLEWASAVQSPRAVATSTARVMRFLFETVQSHLHAADFGGGADSELRSKLKTMQVLVRRGLAISERLRWYASTPGATHPVP